MATRYFINSETGELEIINESKRSMWVFAFVNDRWFQTQSGSWPIDTSADWITDCYREVLGPELTLLLLQLPTLRS